MVTLHWSYHEIADTDYTGIEIKIYAQGLLVETWANFDRQSSWKEVWGNQIETFTLPSLEAARLFITSSDCYERLPHQV